ncbi:MAG: uroporphyrinogen decarboxylase family protein [Armatimonadota bacterium]
MTPKERVRAAIEHHEPDIVPVGEWIVDYEPASLVLGRSTFVRGKATLAHALWDGRRDEIVSGIKRDIVELVRRLDLDMVCADLTYPKGILYERPQQLDHETWRDRHGNVLRYSTLTKDLMVLEEGDASVEPPHLHKFVDGDFRPDPSELEVIEHVMAELGKTHFVFAGMGDARLPLYTALGIEDNMLRLAEDPDGVARDCLAGYQSLARRIPFFAKLGFDAVLVGDDYGFNSGPFMSPATFRRVYFPALKHLCDVAHDNGLFLICHSCGNLRLILPDMIEAGIDVYQAIQPIEDIASLKRDFGRDVCLWGGVSNHDLVLAPPDEIRRQVKQSIEACAPGGGFILGSSHSIIVQTPLENIVAYFEAAGRHPRVAQPV